MKKILGFLLTFMIVLIVASVLLKKTQGDDVVSQTPNPSETSSTIHQETPTPTPAPTYDPSVFTDTNSLLLVANKSHKLPDGYEPSDLTLVEKVPSSATWYLRKPAYEALIEMAEAAKKDGVTLQCGSGYRSYSYQVTLYNNYVARSGKEKADTYSSRPGYSEHQTGLCLDFVENGGALDGYNFEEKFEETKSAKWLYENAHTYGFILRYPKGKEDITGYIYEPWHYRYIGKEEAEKVYSQGSDMTFEEFYHVSGGRNYPNE